MKYVTITANSYEEALRKAELDYGNNIRIHSRRDYLTGSGLFLKKKSRCDLTIYIPEACEKKKAGDDDAIREFEKEAQTPNPSSLSEDERLDTEVYRGSLEKLEKAERILRDNDISEPLWSVILKDFTYEQKVEMEIAARLIDSMRLKKDIDNKYLVLLGPTGSGKTTTCSKIAINSKKMGKSVFIISIDSYRAGSFYQIQKLTDALSIPLRRVYDEKSFMDALREASDSDIVLIDTMGMSKSDDELSLKLKSMLNNLNRANSEFIFVASSTTKSEDLDELYAVYSSCLKIDSLVASKADECSTLGTLLSFSSRHRLPFVCITDGQRVPEDIKAAESMEILRYIKGLDLDLERFSHQTES